VALLQQRQGLGAYGAPLQWSPSDRVTCVTVIEVWDDGTMSTAVTVTPIWNRDWVRKTHPSSSSSSSSSRERPPRWRPSGLGPKRYPSIQDLCVVSARVCACAGNTHHLLRMTNKREKMPVPHTAPTLPHALLKTRRGAHRGMLLARIHGD